MHIDKETRKRLIVARKKCDESLLFFTRFFYKELRGSKFIVNDHHEYLSEQFDDVEKYRVKLLNINIPPRHSKCVSEDTNVMTLEGLKKAKDVVYGDVLYTYDNGKLTTERCLGTEEAYKESVKITMRSGREIICSTDHPMLTTFGYKEASEIHTGERIKAVRTVLDSDFEICDDELIFLTCMLFDGSCSSRTLNFTNADKNIVDLFKASCDNLGINVKQYACNKHYEYNIMGGLSGVAAKILDKNNVLGCKSTEKRLPKDWFNLSYRQKLVFLDLMFATDGYINQINGRCGVCLASKDFIYDIHHLLSTVGIISNIHYKPNDCAGAWAIDISRAETQKLLNMISFHHKRKNALKSMHKKAVFLTDSFPYEIIRREKLSYKARRDGLRCEANKNITRDKFMKLVELYPQLDKYVDEDFYLDTVVSVENVGFKRLIHLEVNRTKNFIANGLVSHNTELALNFIARGIGMNPSSNWLYISASDELRSEASIRIRDIVNHPYFKVMYGVELKKDQNSKNVWKTTKGGGLKTATIFGQVTGFGAGQMTEEGFSQNTINLIRDFEGCQVWDDLNKTEDSERENANNDKVSRVIFNTLLSRENSHDTPIIHSQQRTGLSDATASLMEHFGVDSDKHRFVVMPIIKPDGTPLWPAKFPLDKILEIKNSPKTSHVFESQYMQNPQPMEGALFPANKLQYFTIDQLDKNLIELSAGAIDVADTGKDHTSFPSGVLVGSKFYVTDWLYSQENTEITRPKAISIIKMNDIDYTVIEINNMGKDYYKGVKESVGVKNNVRRFVTTANKLNKINKLAEYIKRHFVFRNDVAPDSDYFKAMTHLNRYMADGSFKFDDAPDSLTLLLELLRKPELGKKDIFE